MTHRDAVDRFVVEMRGRGISPWTSAPPVFRLLWACGSTVPPPHFMPIKSTALLMGSIFAALWGTTMWLWQWSGETHPSPIGAVFASGVGGAAFGLIMAWYLARKRKRLNLPSWAQYLAGGGPSEGGDAGHRRHEPEVT